MSGIAEPHFPPNAIGEPNQQEFRDAMAKLGAAVNVVTTDGPAGRGGFTASAVCSVTDTPPTLLVCVNRNVSSLSALLENKVLCVNTLGTRHREVSRAFGSKIPMDQRFATARWRRGASGAPILSDAVVSFDCRIANTVDVGTHTVFFCEVLALSEGMQEEALMYFRKAYHRLGSDSHLRD